MNMEEIENYISELESMFELSELEEHSRNILKVGIYIKQLQQENKILRENAENNDKVVDKSNWENLKLKKELEEYKRLGFEHLNDKCNKLENQQKEFIEWLTNEANINPYDVSDYIYENIINTILSKYNEIIGSDSK